MKKIEPDYSFTREGQSLEHWLWNLLDESLANRIQAGEVLQAMEWGVPSAHTDFEDMTEFPDTKSQSERFAEAVKSVLSRPEFDTPHFIEKLGAYRLALAEDWEQRISRSSEANQARDEKYERIAQKLTDTIKHVEDATSKARAQRRLEKLTTTYIAGSCNCDDNPMADAEVASLAGVAAMRIVQILDCELMESPRVLESFLETQQLRWEALSALERIGSAGLRFAPQFLRELDSLSDEQGEYVSFDAAQALGAIGRGEPLLVGEMLGRLSHGHRTVRESAALVLRQMAPAVCGREEEICKQLQIMLDQGDSPYAVIQALAAVGRDLPDIRARVLALAGPQTPVLRRYEYNPDYEYDASMGIRGASISAMSYFSAYPEECLPVLIEAIDSFEEYDPDQSYGGPHARIADVIGEFGHAATSAVMPLAQHLLDEPEEMPSSILHALAKIGPAARDALPTLHEVREKLSEGELATDIEKEVANEHDDPVGWAIQQIRGVERVQ